nr:uncharacterized protein LOC121116163 [Lepeophtheirus salmonis]
MAKRVVSNSHGYHFSQDTDAKALFSNIKGVLKEIQESSNSKRQELSLDGSGEWIPSVINLSNNLKKEFPDLDISIRTSQTKRTRDQGLLPQPNVKILLTLQGTNHSDPSTSCSVANGSN